VKRRKRQEPRATVSERFDALIERRRRHRRAVIAGFIGGVVIGVAGSTLVDSELARKAFGLLVIGVVILSFMTPSIVCPSCRERVGNSIDLFCPECGSQRIKRRGIFAPDCQACGRRFKRLPFHSWHIRCCTHCGVLLDPEARETGSFSRNRD
jgi:hypothetical protein